MAHDLGRATFRRTAGAALAHQSERGSKTPEFTEYVERGHNNEWTDQDQHDRPGRDTLEGGDDTWQLNVSYKLRMIVCMNG